MSSDQVTNFEVKIRLLKSSYEDLVGVNSAAFLPGMSANVEIQTNVKPNINCLPIEAVTTRMHQKDSSSQKSTGDDEELDEIVFSIKDGKVVKHIVITGIQDSRYIEITDGLDDIKEVISGPYEAVSKKLEEGKNVTVTDKPVLDKLEE